MPHRELGGATTPLGDLDKIAAQCRSRDIWLHCDGARLLEIAPYYRRGDGGGGDGAAADVGAASGGGEGGVELPELCERFDSVYVSFYKGITCSL